MNVRERYDRFESQPDYLKKWVAGLSEAQYFHIIMESKNFAIVQQDGHSWYYNCYNGMKYAPTKYYLISKTIRNYWYDHGKEIEISGRLNPKKREMLSVMLMAAGGLR